jgi:hypothetical protein
LKGRKGGECIIFGKAFFKIRFRFRDNSHFPAFFEKLRFFKLHRVRRIGSFHKHDKDLSASDAAKRKFQVA